MSKEETKKVCSICGAGFTEWGNNPEPVKSFEEGECCNVCNEIHVIPARLAGIFGKEAKAPAPIANPAFRWDDVLTDKDYDTTRNR